MRSFSILVMIFVIYRHRNKLFLKLNQLYFALAKIDLYIQQENDWRGYVAKKGWAHTPTHTADLLDELANCQEIGQLELLKILDIIKEIALKADQSFISKIND